MKTRFSFLCALAMLAMCASASFADNVTETNSATLEWGTVGTSAVTEGATTLYPSEIDISHTAGEFITDVNVTLNDGAHSFSDDLEITLSYNGVVVELMRQAGGSSDVTGSLTFDDDATDVIEDATDVDGAFGSTGTGTFRTSVWETVDADGTNPLATGVGLESFNGLDGNGTWILHVWDNAGQDTGQFAGGWTLNVVTAVPEPASLGLILLGSCGLFVRRRRS